MIHLREFRRKYYLNQIIRGSLMLLLVISSLLFVGILGEGLLGFSSAARTGIMGFFSLVFLVILGWKVVWPLSKLSSISQPISDRDIASMIRTHFPDIDDKLLNLLELKEKASAADSALAAAAIQRRTEELAPIPFGRAINLNLNLRYARYLLIPFFLFLLLGLINPEVLSLGGLRLLNFTEEYLKPAPFSVRLGNVPDKMISGESFQLNAEVEGDELPEDLYLYLRRKGESSFVNYPMEKVRSNLFGFEFQDVKEDFEYFVGNEEVKSDPRTMYVLARPAVKSFRVVIDHPDYTGIRNDTLPENVGDFKALRGSKITWLVDAGSGIESARFMGADTLPLSWQDADKRYKLNRTVMDDEQYYFSLLSAHRIRNNDTVHYRIDAQQDRFPTLLLNAAGKDFKATLSMAMPLDFEVSDDYGFSKLSFFYRFTQSEEVGKTDAKFLEVPLEIMNHQLLQHKDLEIDLAKLGMNEGDAVEYFLKVWDNDYVSGPKASESSVYTINFPSLDEKFEEVDEKQDDMMDKMEEMEKNAEEVRKAIEKYQEKLLNQKNLSFEDKKELSSLLQKQQNMQRQANELKNEFRENKEFLKQNEMVTPETMQKYDMLQQLIEKMDNPELQKMMEKMQQQMEKMDPRQLEQQLEKMEFDQKEFEKSLERTMELLKQLEVQQKVEELLAKLENLKTRQEILNEKLEETKKGDEESMKEIAEQQEKLEKEMEGINNDLKDLAEKKADTQTPDPEKMEQLQQDGDQGQQQMDNAGNQMQGGNKSNASQSQKNAKQQIQKMMDNLSSMQMQAQQQQDQQNLESLRQLLDNLLKLSFDQEELRDEMKGIRVNDPLLAQKEKEQKQLIDDMYMVKDSLDELAKKVFQISKFVTDESNQILKSMNAAQDAMDDKYMHLITPNQHQAMTSANNLANMLTDVMDQMQQQMKNSKPGMGSCSKPGGKNPNMSQLSQMQQMLNQQMQQMMKGMQEGNGMDPQKLGEMAAQQEAIRKALKEAHDQIQKNGGKALGDLGQVADDMAKTEEELRNQQLTRETLMRQQQILNRLLDSQKAVREKEEKNDSRESNTGKELSPKSPAELERDELENKIRQELLKSNQLEYSSDFIILIEKYFKLLESGNEQ